MDVIEDRPSAETAEIARALQVDLHLAPSALDVRRLLDGADAFLPSPGVPEAHAAFGLAADVGVRTLSEFDLARWWDSRPIAAVTGTDGKTSVTMLTVAMLEASGVTAMGVGNTETPLVEAIDDPAADAFVVEASSFRLAHTERFEPTAAAWLNFSPDHLDVHEDLAAYEAAKAKIWDGLVPDGLAVATADDAVVLSHLPVDRACTIVGLEPGTVEVGGRLLDVAGYPSNGRLVLDGRDIAALDELERTFPHDISNTLVAASLAIRLGATVAGITSALASHRLLPHRIQHVLTEDGVSYYNDSKATVPHAVVTAVRAFDSVVLIAGGKNKGLDLGELRNVSSNTRAVVALGDAADEIVAAFGDSAPVHRAADMDDAVRIATSLAEVGDAVLLSPGCTSFDHYSSYGERGDDFIRAVRELVTIP